MLSPNSRSTVDGNIAVCRERVTVEGTELEIEGFPFISQDADVTVCAQAALWMLVRYFSNRFPHYPETYPVQIGNLTRDYSIGRMFPSSGLYVWQMAEALRQLGFSPLIYERQEFKSFFEHYLYTYVESGIPVLAALDKHVVVLFGHRSDYTGAQQLVPESGMQHFFSSQLNRSFLGHDDNGIPYQMLSHFPSVVSDSMRAAIGSVKSFVVPLAEKVFLPAESFQTVALALLSRADVGIRMSASLSRATLLLRLFLTTGRSFKQRLGERGMGSELAEDVYRATPLPHFVWICELSDPSLYPNSVLGEIVWDATRNVYEPDGWIAVHYPEVLIVDTGSPLNLPENLMRFPILDGQPYPIYRNNLRSVP